MGKVIRVASIDFDGCLSHQNVANKISEGSDRVQACIESNPVLIEQLEKMQINRIMVGSNRQDVFMDVSNANNHLSDGPGSCFPVLKAIGQKVGAEFDDFLMGDLYSEKEHGHTIKKAEDILKGQAQYEADIKPNDVLHISNWLNDKDKISLIYAQIQKLALEHPDDQIEYAFFDDQEKILEAIESFYENNKELIPGNVKIKTFRYSNQNEDPSLPSSMKLDERKEIASSPEVKANSHFEMSLRHWGEINKNPHDDLSLKKEGVHDSLKTWHQFPIEIKSEQRSQFKAIIELTKTSTPAAMEFYRDQDSYKSLTEYKQSLINIYIQCWEKEHYKKGFTIGYSAVLRGMTKELEKEPQLLQMVKDEVKAHFQKDAEMRPSRSSYSAAGNFRTEEFERDWDKYTGAKANIFQKAAKAIMQQFKRVKASEEAPDYEDKSAPSQQH